LFFFFSSHENPANHFLKTFYSQQI